MRLLFVEQNILFAGMALSHFLESFEVVYVSTLREARAQLAAGPFEVLLLGFELEDGTGEELIGEIRSSFRGAIIAASLFDAENTQMLDAGADGACSKSAFRTVSATISAALWRRAGVLWRDRNSLAPLEDDGVLTLKPMEPALV